MVWENLKSTDSVHRFFLLSYPATVSPPLSELETPESRGPTSVLYICHIYILFSVISIGREQSTRVPGMFCFLLRHQVSRFSTKTTRCRWFSNWTIFALLPYSYTSSRFIHWIQYCSDMTKYIPSSADSFCMGSLKTAVNPGAELLNGCDETGCEMVRSE